MAEHELVEAIERGDLESVQSLLDAGADIKYVRPKGYTAIIDAVCNPMIYDGPKLLAALQLLIERGADIDAESEYGESALSVTSRVGRFDAVGLLLDAGANPAPLKWTLLHRAVALGTIEDVRKCLGADVAAIDCWGRTPWLLGVQQGDIEKVHLLLEAGSSLHDRGRCDKTPLMYAVERSDVLMLRWLIDRGIDPNGMDEFGNSALYEAVVNRATNCVRLLLEAGANINHGNRHCSPIGSAPTLEIARMLVAAGADIELINGDVRREITRLPRTQSIDCTAEEFQVGKNRIFGNSNPQLMDLPFWRAMVASGKGAHSAKMKFDPKYEGPAIWCFDRYGTSFSELPDGRVIEIAGEHEDSYDPDFCIYNDVIVHHGDGTFDIYGYPKDVFPPTDFHSATLIGDAILIIGNLGYKGDRMFQATPVYRLDVDTLRIEPVETTGESPGWISKHRARLVGNNIEVTGGKVSAIVEGKEVYEDNHHKYLLSLETLTWSKAP